MTEKAEEEEEKTVAMVTETLQMLQELASGREEVSFFHICFEI